MKLIKSLIVPMLLLMLFSCKDDEKGIDCSLVDCIGGDFIEFEFLKDGHNVLELDSLTEITISQSPDSVLYSIYSKTVKAFISSDTPLTVKVDEITLQIDIESTYRVGECCGGNEIDQLSIGDETLCEGESCNRIIQVELN